MHCQACAAPAVHMTRRHAVSARVCSAACSHELLSGIAPAKHDNNLICINGASPIGQVIAANTNVRRAEYVLVAGIVDRISASMQRIGPQQKRSADTAELPESAQSVAPIPPALPAASVAAAASAPTPASSSSALTSDFNWVSSLPTDAWGIILGMLTPSELGTFGSAGTQTAAIVRRDDVQQRMIQHNVSARRAIKLYMNPNTSSEQLKHLRKAFPHIAEMCVAAIGTIVSINSNAYSITKPYRDTQPYYLHAYRPIVDLFEKYRHEARLDGDALFSRPIHAATYNDVEGDVVKVMFVAIMEFASFITNNKNTNLAIWITPSLRQHCIRTSPNYQFQFTSAPVESPETIPFYATNVLLWKHYQQENLPYGFQLNSPFTKFKHTNSGINTSRHNFSVWFCCSASIADQFPHFADEYESAESPFGFPLPSQAGQIAAFMLAMRLPRLAIEDDAYNYIASAMAARHQLYDNLTTPAEFNSASQESVLFKSNDRRISSASIRNIIRCAASNMAHAEAIETGRPSPLSIRNRANQTPFEVMLLNYPAFDKKATNWYAFDFERLVPFAPASNSSLPTITLVSVHAQLLVLRKLTEHRFDDETTRDGCAAYFDYLTKDLDTTPVVDLNDKLEIINILINLNAFYGRHFKLAKHRWLTRSNRIRRLEYPSTSFGFYDVDSYFAQTNSS